MPERFRITTYLLPLLLALPVLPLAAQPNFPPLSVEISSEHPLFIFQDTGPAETTPEAYAQHVFDAWNRLAPDLQPFAVIQVDAGRTDAHAYYQALLPPLQAASLPLVVRIADADPTHRYPLARLEELFRAFTTVKGVEVTGLAFNEYDLGAQAGGLPLPAVQWFMGVIDAAARYGRFVYAPFDELHWPRIMSNTGAAALYAKMVECKEYVIPATLHRGPHSVTNTSALLGLWLEGAVTNWGVAADSRWYGDARFIAPGVFGLAPGKAAAPASLYRAMVLNGAMTGATVYSFAPSGNLWFGPDSRHWTEVIYPTLREMLDLVLIARRDFVQKKTPVAYRLAPAATPLDFHLNLRDIDPVLDKGLLFRAAYGVERAGQIPELVLNRGDRFWVPLLSAHAPPDAAQTFAEVGQAGAMSSVEQWSEVLDRHAKADGEGQAFIAQVMRGIFVMNTRENQREPQRYVLPAVPAPVRGLVVKREEGAIALSWPLREDDLSWDVYRRILPETRFQRIAIAVDQPRFVDQEPGVDSPIAYAVTALTNKTEALEGTVNYGEYITLSTIFSRIAEEALLSPVLTEAEVHPVAPNVYAPLPPPPPPPETPATPEAGVTVTEAQPAAATVTAAPLPAPGQEAAGPWWPAYEGAPDQFRSIAETLVARIEQWDEAFSSENFFALIEFYSGDYEDPQGWRFQYIRRAYQWFIERYTALRMDRQIRRWDFSNYETTGLVNVLMYCRLCGVAISDPAGRIADQTISLPRTESEEVWITWTNRDGTWRILQTNPALPNFSDLLSYSAGPFDYFPLGPDAFPAE
ncbi:MAG: hypothetical protein HYZ00_09040 [Candidatus Hydrogenedentes bacterium]|nr:hypothetical protein [Candidatus Hydrogenedentota bacterium]